MINQKEEMRFDLKFNSLLISNLTYNELHDTLKNLTSMKWEDIQTFCKRCARLQKATAHKGNIKAFRR